MTDTISKISKLRRPRLLLRAARLGQNRYQRERDLAPLMGGFSIMHIHKVLAHLFDEEGDMEAKRKTGDAGYSVTRHVALLIALLAEAHQATAQH